MMKWQKNSERLRAMFKVERCDAMDSSWKDIHIANSSKIDVRGDIRSRDEKLWNNRLEDDTCISTLHTPADEIRWNVKMIL